MSNDYNFEKFLKAMEERKKSSRNSDIGHTGSGRS
jgi:hypothetical protein